MNSLEFIDEEIKFCQAKINKARRDIIYQQTIALLIPENKNIDFALFNNFHISLNETKIKYLQQIKAELEALKIVKDELVLSVETETAIDGNGGSITGYWLVKGDCQKSYTIIEKQEYEILKKALGVKDDD